MNPNQPNLKPHEQPISFDDLQPAEAIDLGVQPRPSTDQPETNSKSPLVDAALELARTEELPAPPPIPTPSPSEVWVKQEKKPRIEKAEEPLGEVPVPKPKAQTDQIQVSAPSPTSAPVAASTKSEVRREIETILQQGLTDMYLQMQPSERAEFSTAANETASKLELLITQFKATAKEVLRLIRAWLVKIPKINKYFLEQASKIKTDEILEMQKQKRKQARLLH